jgi:hypothetical protein
MNMFKTMNKEYISEAGPQKGAIAFKPTLR